MNGVRDDGSSDEQLVELNPEQLHCEVSRDVGTEAERVSVALETVPPFGQLHVSGTVDVFKLLGLSGWQSSGRDGVTGSGHSISAGPLSLSRAWGLGVVHVAVREPGEGIQPCLNVVEDAAKRRQRFQICFLETTPLVYVDDVVGLFRSEGELLAQMGQHFLSAALFFVRFHNAGARLGAVAIVKRDGNFWDIGALQQERGVQNFGKSGESRGQNVEKNFFAGFFIPQVGAGVGPEIAVFIVPDDDDGHARRWAELGPSDCATVGRGLDDFLNAVLDGAFDRDVLDGGANGAARNECQLDSGMRSDVVVKERSTRVASIRHYFGLNHPEAEELTKSHDANVVTD
jgi:hypothetical protein